jgi:hypothetical protein
MLALSLYGTRRRQPCGSGFASRTILTWWAGLCLALPLRVEARGSLRGLLTNLSSPPPLTVSVSALPIAFCGRDNKYLSRVNVSARPLVPQPFSGADSKGVP